MSALLSIRGATAYYGAVQALKGVDLDVGQGEIVALIGANGAGKSTLMMSIFGAPRLRAGRITFDGRDITDLPTHEIARLSIAQSPEGRRIFARMTVFENLQMGAAVARFDGFAENLDRVYAIFPRLKERAAQRGGTLSGGEQQMLAIARALMSRPKLLLLDEPSLGLAPLICKQIFDVVRRLNKDEGLSVFLVEQDAHHALKLADRGYVMVNGAIAMQGPGPSCCAIPKSAPPISKEARIERRFHYGRSPRLRRRHPDPRRPRLAGVGPRRRQKLALAVAAAALWPPARLRHALSALVPIRRTARRAGRGADRLCLDFFRARAVVADHP